MKITAEQIVDLIAQELNRAVVVRKSHCTGNFSAWDTEQSRILEASGTGSILTMQRILALIEHADRQAKKPAPLNPEDQLNQAA